MVKKGCITCKHGNGSFAESPCTDCAIRGGCEFWEPENPYWERICRLADEQREKGISKYGYGLENNPEGVLTRVRYIEEELIDALYYLEWLKDTLSE